MKLLYFTNVDCEIPAESGVLKKIKSHLKVFSNEGIDCYSSFIKSTFDYVMFDSNFSEIHKFKCKKRGIKKFAQIYDQMLEVIIENQFEVIYVRFGDYSLKMAIFLRRLRKINKNIKVIYEIPTYPLSERWASFWQYIKNKQYVIGMKQFYINSIGSLGIIFFKRYIDFIITNNGFENIWGIPTIKITNGVNVSDIKEKDIKDGNGKIQLLSVANVAYWHGYDRIIDSMHRYYKADRTIKVYYDIVGPGYEIENLKKLVNEYRLDEYVKFHGTVIGDALDSYFHNADLGVSILGAYRAHRVTCDTLKSREYCARCLPFITTSMENMYSNQKFAVLVEDDERPINMEEIVDFYHSVSKAEDIQETMRRFAFEKCDWSVALKNVLDYLRCI